MRNVKIALAVSLGMTAVAIGLVLSESPVTVLASKSVATNEVVTVNKRSATACQADERLPRGTLAIRLSLGAFTGPRVSVAALSGTRVVTLGERGSGWAGQTVTVPVRAVADAVSPVKICFALTLAGDEPVPLYGSLTGPATAARSGKGEALKGRMAIEYLGAGRSSWLALASSVARRMGLGRAWSGTWVALLVLMLMLADTTLASRLILRELDGDG